jgi:hypothetical protein
MVNQPNTLGIGDDMDDIDFIHDIEACFGIKFTDEETLAWYKVEDVFASLKRHFETSSRQNHAAVAARAFYCLRKCMKYFSPAQRISPKTRLDEFGEVSVRQLYHKLAADHKLRQPTLYGGKLHTLGALMIAVGFLASLAVILIWNLFYLLYAILVACVGAILLKYGAWRFPPDCETVGDLAQKFGARNFGLLNGTNFPVREAELWNALLEVISDHSDIPRSEIRPDTLLLQSQIS